MVRWPFEAVGSGWRSTVSEGHRTEPRILTGGSMQKQYFHQEECPGICS